MYSFIEKRLSGVRIHFNSTSTKHETIWYTIIEVINIWVSQNLRCVKRSLRPNWYPCVLVPFCDHSCVLHLLLFRCLDCCGSCFFVLDFCFIYESCTQCEAMILSQICSRRPN